MSCLFLSLAGQAGPSGAAPATLLLTCSSQFSSAATRQSTPHRHLNASSTGRSSGLLASSNSSALSPLSARTPTPLMRRLACRNCCLVSNRNKTDQAQAAVLRTTVAPRETSLMSCVAPTTHPLIHRGCCTRRRSKEKAVNQRKWVPSFRKTQVATVGNDQGQLRSRLMLYERRPRRDRRFGPLLRP